MKQILLAIWILYLLTLAAFSQSGRIKDYSESVSVYDTAPAVERKKGSDDEDTIHIDTDLVTVPVMVMTKGGRPVPDIMGSEFRIFENGEEQKIAYFQNDEAPFTVALMIDMSYSSVFKIEEIRTAALAFLRQLKPQDKMLIVAFDEKVKLLCDVTDNRKALTYAIESIRVGSGTSFYDSLDEVLNKKLSKIAGRKAIVMLTDGVDTTSKKANAKTLAADITESDILIYPIQYDTYDDVQKNRKKDAQVFYDEDDRPYVMETAPGKGERTQDYSDAGEFLSNAASDTGGRVYKVRSSTNLNDAFARIADELRKTYSLGYYPSNDRQPGTRYNIRVRVYRRDLVVRARTRPLSPKR